MENLYSWLFMLSGATITALGCLLIVSERQLRNKRRGFEQFNRNPAAKPVNPPTESQRSETYSPEESIAKNEELEKERSSLSNRLQESQRALDERENEQRRLLSVQSENQQLQEDMGRLRNRFEMSETQLRESDSRVQEAVDLSAMLRKEIAELKQQLAERETAIETLQDEAQNAAAAHLPEQTAMLRSQLETNEERLNETFTERKAIVERHAQLQTRFAELMQQTDELTAKNTQLLKEADALARKLAASEENVKEISAIEQSARLNNQQWLEAHEQGQKEIADFRQQLATAQAQLSESAMSNQEAAEYNRKLISDIGELKQQLEAAVNERETVEQRCSEFQSESQKLRLENHGLQQEIDSHRIQLNASESRSQESARRSHELADRCARLEKDAADYRQRLEDKQSKLREIDSAQELPANTESGSDAIQDATHTFGALSSGPRSSISIESGGDQNVLGPGDSPAETDAAGEERASPRVWTWSKPKWRFGALGAVGVVVIGLGMGFSEGTFLTLKKRLAIVPETNSDEFSAEDVATPQIKAGPRLPGTYETIRTTQVYTGPSENSALIGNIGPKMKLNVVNSSKGWLEIRSRHGRPPGFIRQEAAVRIGQN